MNAGRQLSLDLGELDSGNWKVYVTGHADGNVTSWRGCNYRVKTVPGQPHRGFATKDEAIAFAKEKFPDVKTLREYADRCGDGSALRDDHPAVTTPSASVLFSNGWRDK